MMDIPIYPYEQIDDLQYKGFKIISDKNSFRFGIDAVLLANMAKGAVSDNTIDLCSGGGIVPILLAAKTKTKNIVGLEIQKNLSDMAKRSVMLNNLTDRVEMICADLKEADKLFCKSSFDVVTVNPPYKVSGSGIVSKNDGMAICRHEILCSLEDVIKAAAYLLKPGGRLYMVHRPERLADIFVTMRALKIEPKFMQMVHPSVKKRANIVLIQGSYMGGRELKILEPLYVYDQYGNYTDEILKIYDRQE